MGLTVAEVLFSFWGMKNGRFPKGVLYLLPDAGHAEKVSKTKIQPIISANPLLQSWITKTDSILQKQIGAASLILTGMNSTNDPVGPVRLKSYSVDRVIFDEVEHMDDWGNVALAQKRMDHSEVKWQGYEITGGSSHFLSVPSVPHWGIDGLFAGIPAEDGRGWEVVPSDQRYWFLKCPACGTETCLEDEWPDCVIEVSAREERAIRACRKCQRELDISQGRWVAKEPDRTKRGYHISQLFSHYVNPWKLLDQFRHKRDMSVLFNDSLGIPYIEADARIEVHQVLALCGTEPQLAAFEGPSAMGVDQPKEEGQKFYVTIGYKMEGVPCKLARICYRTTWQEIGDLMSLYNVSRCVVDGLPDQDKARKFAQGFEGRVFMSYYAEKQKGAAKWNENDWSVSVDRTEIHNSLTRMVHGTKIALPRQDDDIKGFAKHLFNMARKTEKDDDTGSVRQVWKKTGADHWRHSACYMLMALDGIGEYVKPKEEKDWMHERRRVNSWRTM